MQKLKARWGIDSNFQLIIIFIVFAITGSSSVYVAKPFLDWIGFDRESFPDAFWSPYAYWFLRLVLIFPFYQVLLLAFGWLFGQFNFFWEMEKKILRKLGISL